MAVPNKNGTFGTNGTWTTAANWGGVAPAASDNLIVRSTAQNITGGTGVGYNDFALDELIIANDYTGTIGSAGTPLALDLATAVTGRFVYYGSGASAYFDGAYDSMQIQTTVMQTNAFVFGTLAASTATTMSHVRGRLTIGGTGTVTTLGTSRLGFDMVQIAVSTGGTVTTGHLQGGNLTNAGTVTTANIFGDGQMTQSVGGASTTVNVYGGRFVFNGGTATTINVFGGIIDFMQGSTQRIVTTINAWGGAIRAQQSPNFSATPTLNMYGPCQIDAAFLSTVSLA